MPLVVSEVGILMNIVLYGGSYDSKRHPILSPNTVRSFLKRHRHQLKTGSASGIDPKRAEQATEEVRAASFTKLDYFVRFLYETKRCPYKNAAALPNRGKDIHFRLFRHAGDLRRKEREKRKECLWEAHPVITHFCRSQQQPNNNDNNDNS